MFANILTHTHTHAHTHSIDSSDEYRLEAEGTQTQFLTVKVIFNYLNL